MTWLKRPRAVQSLLAVIFGVVAIAAAGYLPDLWGFVTALLGGSSIAYAMHLERQGGWTEGVALGFVTAITRKEDDE